MSNRPVNGTPERWVAATCEQIGMAVPDRASARRIRLPEQPLPFLADALGGRETWQIEIEDLDSIRRNPQAGRIPRVSRLSVVLVPGSDLVLRVDSPWPAGVPAIAPFPPPAEEEEQLRWRGDSFPGTPEARPTITLAKALKVVDVEAPVALPETRQIIAYHVLYATTRYPGRPVWIVQTRGIPPIPTGFSDRHPVPADAINHLRHVVDARTGEWLGSDTAPQPVSTAPGTGV